jgi:peptidoglycan/LPS O-acetylase OafA/YrhL
MDFMHGNGWIRCLFGFTAGLLLYRISQLTEAAANRRLFDRGAFVFLVAQFLMLQFMKEEFVFVLLSVGLIFCLSHAEGSVTRVLNSKPLLYLGEISFSIYMWHALIGKMFQDAYRAAGLPTLSVPVSIGLLIALIGVILVVSAVSYHVIELRLSVALRKRVSALISR